MADWTSTVTTWHPEWMRSTTRARLDLCRAAREGRQVRFRFLEDDHERLIPSADNASGFADVLRRWDAGSRGSIPR